MSKFLSLSESGQTSANDEWLAAWFVELYDNGNTDPHRTGGA